MVLNRLVWNCYTRHTRHYEEGLEIRIEPTDNERILFFDTDTPDGRRGLGLPLESAICDAVVFYRGASNIAMFLLAELKSCKYSHAITQIQNTYDALITTFYFTDSRRTSGCKMHRTLRHGEQLTTRSG
jgi:hypothetical protein